MLRIRARIPVVVMGETGCGKTSLVKFLSIVAGVEFKHMDFHAGISEQGNNKWSLMLTKILFRCNRFCEFIPKSSHSFAAEELLDVLG